MCCGDQAGSGGAGAKGKFASAQMVMRSKVTKQAAFPGNKPYGIIIPRFPCTLPELTLFVNRLVFTPHYLVLPLPEFLPGHRHHHFHEWSKSTLIFHLLVEKHAHVQEGFPCQVTGGSAPKFLTLLMPPIHFAKTSP